MEPTKLSLVNMSAEELAKAETDGKSIVLLPDSLRTMLADKFFGGYSSGTAPMGPVPNAIVLKE